jgi:cytochrome c oxidase assembly factor CtaG
MLGFGVEGSELVLTTYLVAVVVAVTLGILVVHGFMRNRRLEQVVANAPWWLVGSVWAAMLFLILISQGSGDAFIYFQF